MESFFPLVAVATQLCSTGCVLMINLCVCVCMCVCVCAAAFNEDSKLAGRCIDVLLEALSLYPHHTQVWMCSLYAILQILNNNSKSLKYKNNFLSRK